MQLAYFRKIADGLNALRLARHACFPWALRQMSIIYPLTKPNYRRNIMAIRRVSHVTIRYVAHVHDSSIC
jgi:hypothetical protein